NFSGPEKFIGISSPCLTWFQAQAYCRTHYTDLASSLNSSDNEILGLIQYTQGFSWIGLYRDTWKWSDGSNATNIPWAPGKPDNSLGKQNCAVLNNGQFIDSPCTDSNYFFCYY
ncbi:macrophage mannose receptor 1-like isoform X6, partial [Clarias magur]